MRKSEQGFRNHFSKVQFKNYSSKFWYRKNKICLIATVSLSNRNLNPSKLGAVWHRKASLNIWGGKGFLPFFFLKKSNTKSCNKYLMWKQICSSNVYHFWKSNENFWSQGIQCILVLLFLFLLRWQVKVNSTVSSTV